MFLRMVARPLMAMAKQTTGVKKVPEDVVPDPREILIGLHRQILNQIKKLPEDMSERRFIEEHSNEMIDSTRYIPNEICYCPSLLEPDIEEARRDLQQVTDLAAECHIFESHPLSPATEFVGKPTARNVVIWLYNEALKVLRKVPVNKQYNNYLRLYAKEKIGSKLKICQQEDDWESIKSRLHSEDPIQTARDELNHWNLFFGSGTRPRPRPRRRPFHHQKRDRFCHNFF